MNLKWNPLKWNWPLFKKFSGGWSKGLLHQKGKKNPDLSYDVRRFFSANESYHFFLLYLRFKRSCSDACFSVENFVRLKRRDGRDGTRQKSGSG